MLSFDLPGAAVKLYMAIRQDKELQAWFNLILGTIYSAFIAFTGITGAALSSGSHWSIAIGSGLLACAASVLAVLLRDPRARLMLLSIPKPIIEELEKTQSQTTIEPVEPPKTRL